MMTLQFELINLNNNENEDLFDGVLNSYVQCEDLSCTNLFFSLRCECLPTASC